MIPQHNILITIHQTSDHHDNMELTSDRRNRVDAGQIDLISG